MKSFFGKLKKGLSRSSQTMRSRIKEWSATPDQARTTSLEDLLIEADMGPAIASELVASAPKTLLDKRTDSEALFTHLADGIEKKLAPMAKPMPLTNSTNFILVLGMNGAGKTTLIGKLAKKYKAENKKVMLIAGDSFRAAACEQLSAWAKRTGAEIITGTPGADAASLAHIGFTKARAEGYDIVLMDTAGRIETRQDLLAEIEKIIRVVQKIDEHAPHISALVIDANNGQNALSQLDKFSQIAGISARLGLIITKLDSTARAGFLLAIAEKNPLPLYYIGMGEGEDDLAVFSPRGFARNLFGLAE